MNDLMKSILGINWKTTLAGIGSFLSGVPGFVTALQAWAAGQPVNWREVGVSAALTLVGAGLAAAKDSTTHSNAAEVDAATPKQ